MTDAVTDAENPADDSGASAWRARQREHNLGRSGAWESSAPHRDRVTAELARGFSAANEPRLALLGVGPAVDVDLPALLSAFATIDAADLDGVSLAEGLERQGVAGAPRVVARPGDDLLPTADAPFAGEAAAGYAAGLEEPRVPDWAGGGYDAAASLTLLTQLIDRVAQAVGPAHSDLPAFAAAVRAGHLRTLAGLLKPGGVGLLVCDLFSDATCPDLKDATDAGLPDLAMREIARGNVFQGVHPENLRRTLLSDVPGKIEKAQLLAPWVWSTGERRFAVTALKFRMPDFAGTN